MTRTGEEMCKEGSPWKYSKRKFLCVFNKKVTAYFEIEKELAFDEKMLPAAKKKKIEMGKDLVNQVGVRSISRSNPTTKTPDQNNSNQTTFVFFPSSQGWEVKVGQLLVAAKTISRTFKDHRSLKKLCNYRQVTGHYQHQRTAVFAAHLQDRKTTSENET